MDVEKTIASPGRGILSMDESNATCGKHMPSIGQENTEDNQLAYRTLVTIPGIGQCVSGAILFEETLYQSTSDGRKIVDVLVEQNVVVGIKVDKPNPWHVSFSHARALQNTCLKTWGGRPVNVKKAKETLLLRAKANSLAQLGKYKGEGESEEAMKGMFVKGYVY
ncbi:Glycolytic domain-containing protein [Cephalotus follicularis]|uniref:fructose-bisphosphate aldolase n=1 Tax=Cephalotus follicularis TaxID=3775 RepID=A0A1Q3C726_CEPFO|nr:Glycolytic domain-containing protein [Cephalotus follicularis]